EHMLDYGGRYFYAPQSFTDAAGRRVMFGWVQEGRSAEEQLASGWSGVMSLPRILSLGLDGRVRANPAPELAALRGEHTQIAAMALPAGQTIDFPEIAGDALEILAELDVPSGASCSLLVRRSPDGAEYTRICYDA